MPAEPTREIQITMPVDKSLESQIDWRSGYRMENWTTVDTISYSSMENCMFLQQMEEIYKEIFCCFTDTLSPHKFYL